MVAKPVSPHLVADGRSSTCLKSTYAYSLVLPESFNNSVRLSCLNCFNPFFVILFTARRGSMKFNFCFFITSTIATLVRLGEDERFKYGT